MKSQADDRPRFVVADTFEIEGRGLVLAPGFPVEGDVVRVGDRVLLHRPDGTVFAARIAGLEMIHPRPPRPVIAAPISVRGVPKTEVPIGTEVTLEPGSS